MKEKNEFEFYSPLNIQHNFLKKGDCFCNSFSKWVVTEDETINQNPIAKCTSSDSFIYSIDELLVLSLDKRLRHRLTKIFP
jgi:hypothetical protein